MACFIFFSLLSGCSVCCFTFFCIPKSFSLFPFYRQSCSVKPAKQGRDRRGKKRREIRGRKQKGRKGRKRRERRGRKRRGRRRRKRRGGRGRKRKEKRGRKQRGRRGRKRRGRRERRRRSVTFSWKKLSVLYLALRRRRKRLCYVIASLPAYF